MRVGGSTKPARKEEEPGIRGTDQGDQISNSERKRVGTQSGEIDRGQIKYLHSLCEIK